MTDCCRFSPVLGRSHSLHRCLAWLMLLSGAWMQTAVADDAERSSEFSVSGGLTVSAGFAGLTKTAAWTPIRVQLPAGESATRLRVWAADTEDQPVGSPWQDFTTTAAGGLDATVHIRLGRPDGQLAVELADADGSRAPQTVDIAAPLPQSASLVLVLGDLTAASRGVRLLEDDDGWRPTVVTATVDDLPGSSSLDFDAADAVVVCGSVCPLPEPVFKALDGWVRDGGRLVFLAGDSLEKLAAADAPELGWLPGRFERLVPLRSTAAIETFARASRPLPATNNRLQMPLLAPLPAGAGTTLAAVGPTLADLPLAVRFPHDFGTIGWLAFDLDQGAFENWPGSDSLFLAVLGRERTRAGRAGETRRDLLDMSGQLRRSVDQFTGVQPVPFELIGLLAILFVTSLYPLSWWLAKPPSGRGGWIALAVAIVAFTLLASTVGDRWKASEWQSTAAGLVDVDVSSHRVRGFSMTGFWASENTAIALSAEPAADQLPVQDGQTVISWAASTGRSFGGPDTLVPHASLAAAPYSYSDNLSALEKVPLAIATSGTWQAAWNGQTTENALSGRFERTAEGTLRGELINELPFPLEDCLLAYAGWLYEIGPLASGERFDPSRGRGPRSLSGAIARREAVGEREQGGRYDTAERNADRILVVASFHEAAGGRSYTSLETGLLGRYDLSDLLQSGRAVLIGRGPRGTTWTTDQERKGDEDPHALWRFVLPVGRGFGSSSTDHPTSEAEASP